MWHHPSLTRVVPRTIASATTKATTTAAAAAAAVTAGTTLSSSPFHPESVAALPPSLLLVGRNSTGNNVTRSNSKRQLLARSTKMSASPALQHDGGCGRSALATPCARVHCTPVSYEKVVIGNPSNGHMDPVHVSWTDIAGLDITSTQRLAAGKVLSMMDMCAARAAGSVAAEVTRRTGKRYLSATVGVTNTVFSSALMHGDAIRMDGRVVHCGDSSLGIYIRFYRLSPTTRTESPAGESFFTMVTMTPDLKAAKIVPAMELTDPLDVAMHYRYTNIRAVQKENTAEWALVRKRVLTREEVDCPINAGKSTHVTIQSTQTVANRIFFSAFLNNNNTVFGGELMAWMELHATHCARMFTGNRNIYCIGMHSVSFDQPVYATDWVTLHATVIYVRNTTMEVDVKITVERKGNGDVVSNRASFVLINENDIGQKSNIPIGLDLQEASQEELHAFHEARWRYSKSVDRRQNFQKILDAHFKQLL